MRDYSSFRIGGVADMVTVTNEEELIKVIQDARTKGRRIHILGGGTNTYFGENLTNLLVIKINTQGITYEKQEEESKNQDTVLLRVAAGECWDNVVQFSVDKNLWGLENLSLIPGTAGAAPVQNIGAYGVELKDVFYSLRAYDIVEEKIVEFFVDDCQFGYRDSLFKQKKGRYVILSVTLKVSTKENPILTYKPLTELVEKKNITLREIRNIVVLTRKTKLPDYEEHPNAGSFFKNPIVTSKEGDGLRAKYPDMPFIEVTGGYKVLTAWLIEHIAVMKGVRVGGVGTWPNQPLVIVNYGGATANEIDSFTQNIQKIIQKKTGITLEQEVCRVD